MKSVVALMLLVLGVVTLAACDDTGTGGPSVNNTLTVGAPSLSGDYIAGFTNSAYDVWVRDLINGYGTFTTNQLGEIVLNTTVVKELDVQLTDEGHKEYKFEIHQDLYWSDGEKITAEDFVFSILFGASRNWQLLGASSTTGEALVGRNAYRSPVTGQDAEGEDIIGTTSVGVYFEGVRLYSDFTFGVIIDKARLPYYYETAYASYGPMPMHVLAAPGATVISDENGSTLSAGALANIASITATGGYRYQPTVTAGPYKFVSMQQQVATLVRDPLFKGDFQGKTPTIDRIIIKAINSALDVDLVIAGEIDLATGVIEGAKIQKALNSPQAGATYYARNGYGFLAMTADSGPTKDNKVRQAVAHLTDRLYVADIVLEGYGSLVESEYGLAQWMYQESKDWVEDTLINYVYSPTRANELLDETEWKFEADGVTPFDPAKAAAQNTGSSPLPYVRHNAEGEKMELRHMGSENNIVTTSLKTALPRAFALAGIDYYSSEVDFSTLLDNYYGEGAALQLNSKGERVWNLYNLATTFAVAYDPYYTFGEEFYGTWRNPYRLENAELSALTVQMRSLEPTQRAEFLQYWREYQVLWNELIPNVPLYSNQYYDIYNARVSGLEVTPFWNWTRSIVDMRLS